jgi:hypothetical protein
MMGRPPRVPVDLQAVTRDVKARMSVVAAAMKRKHLGCRQAGIKSCECFGTKVVREPRYVVWATPAHLEKPWAVGHELRPGCR